MVHETAPYDSVRLGMQTAFGVFAMDVNSFKSDSGHPQQNLVASVDLTTKIFLFPIGSGHVPNVVHTR